MAEKLNCRWPTGLKRQQCDHVRVASANAKTVRMRETLSAENPNPSANDWAHRRNPGSDGFGVACATRERTMGRGAIAAAETRRSVVEDAAATDGAGALEGGISPKKRSPKETEGRKG
jgi:hypothetical protein